MYRPLVLLSLAVVVLGVSRPASAQQSEATSPGVWARLAQTTPLGVADAPKPDAGAWSRTFDGIGRIWSTGGDDIYVTGFIWHFPWRYDDARRSTLNQEGWGLGYGRSFDDAAGRRRGLFALVSRDSYSNLQYMAGYTWRARGRLWGSRLQVGGGYSALLISRHEYLHHVPLPLIVPVGSLGTDRFDLMATYVPYAEAIFVVAHVTVRSARARLPR